MVAFKKAERIAVQLLISFAGGTGSGKTWSSLTLAKGLSGGKRFAVIDTERGRSKHYADFFDFDIMELSPPFTPDRYSEAIMAADAAGYPVIVVDQFSSEWAGEGGCLDMQEAELDRMAGDDWKKRESCKIAAWIRPKMAHKHMMQKVLQVNAHLVLAFRAEEKIEIVKQDGKVKIVPKQSVVGLNGWVPISEKNLPYEMTASFLMTADAPGVPKPIKLQHQHRPFFPLDTPITEDSGKRLGEWAKGGTAQPTLTVEAFGAKLNACSTVDDLKAEWLACEPMIADAQMDAAKDAYKARLNQIRGAA